MNRGKGLCVRLNRIEFVLDQEFCRDIKFSHKNTRQAPTLIAKKSAASITENLHGLYLELKTTDVPREQHVEPS